MPGEGVGAGTAAICFISDLSSLKWCVQVIEIIFSLTLLLLLLFSRGGRDNLFHFHYCSRFLFTLLCGWVSEIIFFIIIIAIVVIQLPSRGGRDCFLIIINIALVVIQLLGGGGRVITKRK